MNYRLALLGSVLLLGLAAEAYGQKCWGQSRGPVGPALLEAPAAPSYVWKHYQDCYYLYWGDRQVGGYNPAEDVFRTFEARTGTWGRPQAPPWKPKAARKAPLAKGADQDCKDCKDPACHCKDGGPCTASPWCRDSCHGGRRMEFSEAGEPIENFGIERQRLDGGQNHYYIRGDRVPRQQFMEVVQAASLSDDSQAARITVIGPKELRKPVLDMLAAMPEIQGAAVKAYDANHWAVHKAGFKTDGRPTIYVQQPNGDVVARFDAPPAQPVLARAVLQAKRQADPNYDPKKDPQGPAPAAPWQDLLQSPWGPVVGLGGGLLLLLLRKKG